MSATMAATLRPDLKGLAARPRPIASGSGANPAIKLVEPLGAASVKTLEPNKALAVSAPVAPVPAAPALAMPAPVVPAPVVPSPVVPSPVVSAPVASVPAAPAATSSSAIQVATAVPKDSLRRRKRRANKDLNRWHLLAAFAMVNALGFAIMKLMGV